MLIGSLKLSLKLGDHAIVLCVGLCQLGNLLLTAPELVLRR
jgi:hypothetical protein